MPKRRRIDFEALAGNPGPVVVGAAQGASCFGPAYEYAFIVDTELRKRKIRDQVPMYFVTPEPYIGHLGLDGVGDTKGLMESELRQRHIRWITNAKIRRNHAPAKFTITEVDENAADKKQHELDFKHAMILPAFKGIDAVLGHRGTGEPARLHPGGRVSAQSGLPQRLRGRGLCRHSAGRADTAARWHARRPAT